MTGSTTFLAAIELVETDGNPNERTFYATTQYVPWPKSYGGDLLAQAAASAGKCVPGDRVLHSMHSLFLRPADVGERIRYVVSNLRDGRSYSAREVKAYQAGDLVFSGLFSFHVGEESASHSLPMPGGVPAPEELPTSSESLAGDESAAARYWSQGRSFDIRHVEGPIYRRAAEDRSDREMVWIRAFDLLPDDPQIHRLALAYVCDYTILEPILRNQGLAWMDQGLTTASLDHALWYHDDGRMDDWVLYTQSAESFTHGRGLVRGTFHSKEGKLLASVAQQGMIRQTTTFERRS